MSAISNDYLCPDAMLGEQGEQIDQTKHLIPLAAVQMVLQGVCVATKTPREQADPVFNFISSMRSTTANAKVDDDGNQDAFSFSHWCATAAASALIDDEVSYQLFKIAISVAYIRQKSRQGLPVKPTDLSLVWGLIHDALTTAKLERALFHASRSAQGLIAVPLCSLINHGRIEELFRLHVWLPDGCRGNPQFSIHSHQPFGQSWILAGQSENLVYDVTKTTDPAVATHAEFALSWDDGKGLSTTYKTHQSYSSINKTERLACVTLNQAKSRVHVRDMAYAIQEGTFHSTIVAPDRLHATLFFFDSTRGFTADARVMGPLDAESFLQRRDPSGVTPATLARDVEATRKQEVGAD